MNIYERGKNKTFEISICALDSISTHAHTHTASNVKLGIKSSRRWEKSPLGQIVLFKLLSKWEKTKANEKKKLQAMNTWPRRNAIIYKHFMHKHIPAWFVHCVTWSGVVWREKMFMRSVLLSWLFHWFVICQRGEKKNEQFQIQRRRATRRHTREILSYRVHSCFLSHSLTYSLIHSV